MTTVPTFDERDRDLAERLDALEAARRTTTDPVQASRLDKGIEATRALYAAHRQPHRAAAINEAILAKAEADESAVAAVERRADELIRDDPSLTPLQAFKKAAKEPEMIALYKRETDRP